MPSYVWLAHAPPTMGGGVTYGLIGAGSIVQASLIPDPSGYRLSVSTPGEAYLCLKRVL